MGQCISKKDPKQNDILTSTIEYQNELIDSVLQKKKFHICSVTEFGSFGPTINIKFPPMRNEIAVKILKQENIGPEEIAWYHLYNENTLSLIHIEFVEDIDVFLFYTEDWNYTLKEMITNEFLQKCESGIKRVTKWLKQVAAGLNYMHWKNFFHLNLSTENIVLTDEDNAKITNFHYVCSRKAFSERRCGLPLQFRPPETFCEEKGNFGGNPENFDVWSLGIVMVDMLTDEYLSRKLPSNAKVWAKDIYPVMNKVLQKTKFNRLVKKKFPASYKSVNLKAIRTLASYVLSFDHINRPSAYDINYLLSTLDIKLHLQEGNIWQKKVSWRKLENNFSLKTEKGQNPENSLKMYKDEMKMNFNTRNCDAVVYAIKQKSKTLDSLLFETDELFPYPNTATLDKKVTLNRHEEIKKIWRDEREGQKYCKNEYKFNDFLKINNEKSDTRIDSSTDGLISRKNEKINLQSKPENLCHPEAGESNDKEYTDESTKQQNNATKSYFSIGKQLHRFLRWTVNASFSYEMTSSTNYLHSLSKKLTK